MRSMLARAVVDGFGVVVWLALVAIAVFGWYATARGLALTWGLRDAATGVGLIVGAAVAVTMWRWARAEHESNALADGACPRCGAPIEERHEHAHPGEHTPGLTAWTCNDCGYERTQTLTCPACAA